MKCLPIALGWCLGTATILQAQTVAPNGFNRDASAVFSVLAAELDNGFLGLVRVFTASAEGMRLARADDHDPNVLGVWSVVYGGKNATGEVTVFASFPAFVNHQRNNFWLRFETAAETAMPGPVIEHLLKTASETVISGGDTLDLKFPFKSTPTGCTTNSTIRLRLTTGALVSNLVEASCPVNKAAEKVNSQK